MSGLRRLSDTALVGAGAGAATGYVPVYSAPSGHFAPAAPPSIGGPSSNFSPQNFAKWRAACMKVRDGSGFAKILTAGDSTAWGQGGGGSNPAFLKAWPKRLSELLNSYYVPSAPGLQVYGENTADTRWTLGTGWSRATFGQAGFGGSSMRANSATTATTFAPGYMCDTVDVYYVDNAQGTVALTMDTAETVNLVGTGSTGVKKTSLSFARASTHTMTFGVPSGNNSFFILGVEPYDSTIPSVRVGLTGISNSTAALWASATASYNSLNAIGAYAPDLTLLMLGINDADSSVSLASWIASNQAIITKAKLSGDVIIASVIPSSAAGLTSGAAGVALEQSYAAAGPALAAANNCGFLDINSRWVDYNTSNTAGYYSDTKHGTGFGYCDIAQAFFNALKTI